MSAFEPFGLQHWLATGITAGAGVLLPVLLRRFASPQGKELARKIIAVLLFADVGLGPVVSAGVYGLPLQHHLPLHLCGISGILGAIMLWFRSFSLYEVVYFWGIGGVFATVVMGFRPRAASLAIVLATTAAYALLIYPVNLLLGSNYLFLVQKPAQPSLLDFFGPWPWYLAGLVALAVGVCVALYLPFGIYDFARCKAKRP